MHNTWELEEDDDSDVSGEAAPINRQKVAVTTTSGGKPHEFLNSRVTKVSQADNSVNRNNTNQHFATSSNGFYSDDDIDDLDVEELPESFPSSKNIMEVPTKNDLTTNHLVTKVANGSNQYGSSSTGIASDRDLLDREEISVEKLKRVYDEAAKASQGGGYSSELSVDKIELSRIIRKVTNSPSLADDILNVSKRGISYSALMTVAKPYMEKEKAPQKPSRDAAPHTDHKDVNKRSTSDVQIKDVIKGESLGFQNHDSAGHDTDISDDDDDGGGDGNQMIKENKRDTEKENKSNQNLHRSFQNTPLPAADSSIVSVSKWPTQSRRELPTSKSIEQESWHNQSYEGDPRLETPHTDEGRSEKDSAAKDMKNHQNEARGWSNRTSQSKTMETIPKSGTPLPSSHLDPVSSEDVRHRTTEQQMTTKPLSQQNNQNSSSLIERSKIDDEVSDSSSVAEHRRRFARESSSDSPTSNDSKRRKSPDPGISDEKKTRIEKENESKLSTSQLLLLEKDQKKTNLRTGKGTGDSSDFPPNSMLPVASSWETAVSEGLQQEQSREMKNEERNPMKLYHSEKMFERKKNNMGYVRSKGKREDRPASMPLPQNQSQDLQKKSENDNIKRPSSLSQSVDETYVKRSISWSAAVSGNGKPPRPKSISSVPSSIFMPTSSSSSSAAVKSKSQRNVKTKENSLTSSFKDIPVTSLDFDGHVALPPLSEYALKTGVIMEGWVEKKSSVTGFWQKAVSTVSAKVKKGREFSLSFLLPDKESNLPSSHQTRSRSSTDASQREGLKAGEDQDYATSNNGSGEDGESINTKGGVGKFKLMTLKAENLLARILWVALFDKVLHLYNNDDGNFYES